MTPSRFQRIAELFAAAAAMAPAEREAYLQTNCEDAELRSEVEKLLAVADRDRTALSDRVQQAAADMAELIPGAVAPRATPGQTIGPYRVVSLIGRGGMGEVYAAEDLRLGRQVALKLLPVLDALEEPRVRRFQQEARAASALNHPNIVTIYDFGQVGGVFYIAGELVQGRTVRQVMEPGPLAVREAVATALQVAAALAAAHEAGIVHRDIKPENLMVRPDGYVKVLDFGLAKLRAGESSDQAATMTLSRPGMVLGTARYMSPEQVRSAAIDGRSDLFSLGVVLYEMVAGRPPFGGETSADAMAAILEREPAPLGCAELQEIVARCLQKDPAARYPGAKELVTVLEKVRHDLDSVARPALVRRRILARVPRRQVLAWAAGVLAAGGLGVLARRRTRISTENLRITEVPGDSNLSEAVISPDGRFAVYKVFDGERTVVRVKPLAAGSNEITIMDRTDSSISGLSHSPDGAYLYYVLNRPDQVLYRQFALGGTPQKLVDGVRGPVSLSPDSRRMIFVKVRARSPEQALMVAEADGAHPRPLKVSRETFPFLHYKWAPDGKSIRHLSGFGTPKGNQSFVAEIRVDGGVERVLLPPSFPPMATGQFAPFGGIFFTAADPNEIGHQIYYANWPDGKRYRLTRDSNDYRSLSLSADGKMLLAMHQSRADSIWTADLDRRAGHDRQVTGGFGSYWALAWISNHRLVVVQGAGNKRDLWVMTADGGPLQQVTFSGNVMPAPPEISRDGRYVAFLTRDSIWRLELDGGRLNLVQDGIQAASATFSPDGRAIFYGDGRLPGGIWSVPAEGGTPTRFSGDRLNFVVSRDGKRRATIAIDEVGRPAVIRQSDGSGPVRRLPLPSTSGGILHLDEDALLFVSRDAARRGIWRIPLDGSPFRPLLLIPGTGYLACAVSPDGRRAAWVVNRQISRMMLFENFR